MDICLQQVAVKPATRTPGISLFRDVWGAMAWGGQWCTSPGYAVVHESIAEQFVAECKKAVVDLYGVDPKSNSDYSRVISRAAVDRLVSVIDPKKVVYGGKSDASARYLDPTILYPISWSDKIMEDEIFGPLLPILTYSELGKLLAKVKSISKPLAGYVFSRNQATIDRVLQSLSGCKHSITSPPLAELIALASSIPTCRPTVTA